jgi:hypothetical protein
MDGCRSDRRRRVTPVKRQVRPIGALVTGPLGQDDGRADRSARSSDRVGRRRRCRTRGLSISPSGEGQRSPGPLDPAADVHRFEMFSAHPDGVVPHGAARPVVSAGSDLPSNHGALSSPHAPDRNSVRGRLWDTAAMGQRVKPRLSRVVPRSSGMSVYGTRARPADQPDAANASRRSRKGRPDHRRVTGASDGLSEHDRRPAELDRPRIRFGGGWGWIGLRRPADAPVCTG